MKADQLNVRVTPERRAWFEKECDTHNARQETVLSAAIDLLRVQAPERRESFYALTITSRHEKKS